MTFVYQVASATSKQMLRFPLLITILWDLGSLMGSTEVINIQFIFCLVVSMGE